MLKRLGIIGMMGAALFAVVLIVWQPDALKTDVLRHIANEVSHSSPYDVTMGRASGNIFTGIVLKDVHLLAKSDHSEILHAKALKIGISWLALLHKSIQINRLDWTEPTVRLLINEEGKFISPFPVRSAESKPSSFSYSIKELTIEKGQINLQNRSLSPSQELGVRDISLKARVTNQEIVIDELQMRLEDGRASLAGRLQWQPVVSSQWSMDTQRIPIQSILRVAGSPSLPLDLTHSGHWKIQTSSQDVDVLMQGDLSNGPIVLSGTWTRAGITRADLTWTKPSLVSTSLHLTDGQGPFVIQISSAEFRGAAQGELNLPHRSIKGKGSLEKIVWQGKRAEKIDFTFSADRHHEQLEATAQNVQFQAPLENPFDIKSLQLSLNGLAPRWQSAAQVAFRNGSSVDFDGFLNQMKRCWQLDWKRLKIAFPSAGSWAAQQPGSVTWSSRQPLELHDLDLANGKQTLQIPMACFGDETRLRLFAKEMNPGPWTTLFLPDLVLKGGVLNAALEVRGRSPHLRVDGYINGKVQSLTLVPLGTDLHTIEIDIRSANQNIEVKRFTGKTKKGDIAITGASLWPKLDYTLLAKELMIRPDSFTKATASAQLHLGGSSEAPILTGHIDLQEGVYAIAPKGKEKKAPTPLKEATTGHQNKSAWLQTSLDVTLQWPRNVWYRDGVTNIETRGDLRIQKPPSQTNLVLAGTINSIRGTYNYFGRDFTIESGELRFAGTPDINPAMKIVASYRSDPTIVYLDITGNAKQPVLALRSNPPLPEQDIISVVVFGQPLNELRSRTGGQSTNQQMMQAAGGVLGSYVSKELRQTGIRELDFDVMNLQPTSQGSQLTVGRYLTRRLFISYGQVIHGSAEKSVTADYFLTDRWTLEGATGSVEGNHMDFLFRYPLKNDSHTNASAVPSSPFRNTLDPLNPLQSGFGR